MPKTCAVASCRNTASDSVSLHKAPDDDRGKHWKEFVLHTNRDYNWNEPETIYVCSAHFTKDAFIGPTLCKPRIAKDAYPVLLDGTKIDIPKHKEEERCIKPLQLFKAVNLPCQQKNLFRSSGCFEPMKPCQLNLSLDNQCSLQELKDKDQLIDELTQELQHKNSELKNCKKRLVRCQQAKRKLKETATESAAKAPRIDYPPENDTELKQLLNQITDRPKNSRLPYSEPVKELSYSVYYHSTRAYEELREKFQNSLPHPRNFSRWTSHINASPGFLNCAIEFIKEKCQSSPKELFFSLSCDEIHIRKQILFRDGQFIGYTNYGGIGIEPDDDKEASAALFILATEVNGSLRIPIGYILTNGLPSGIMAQVIRQSLEKMHHAGARILSITFDGLRANLKSVELLGANLDPLSENLSPYISHPITQEKVFIILDPSHMLKLLRNYLKTNNLKDMQNRTITWRYISDLHSLQVSNGLRAANKITSRHVSFENQKMKTKLCTQTISNSVAVALRFCRKIGQEEFKDSEGTEIFLQCLDRYF